jgi:hypothetical protein
MAARNHARATRARQLTHAAVLWPSRGLPKLLQFGVTRKIGITWTREGPETCGPRDPRASAENRTGYPRRNRNSHPCEKHPDRSQPHPCKAVRPTLIPFTCCPAHSGLRDPPWLSDSLFHTRQPSGHRPETQPGNRTFLQRTRTTGPLTHKSDAEFTPRLARAPAGNVSTPPVRSERALTTLTTRTPHSFRPVLQRITATRQTADNERHSAPATTPGRIRSQNVRRRANCRTTRQ